MINNRKDRASVSSNTTNRGGRHADESGKGDTERSVKSSASDTDLSNHLLTASFDNLLNENVQRKIKHLPSSKSITGTTLGQQLNTQERLNIKISKNDRGMPQDVLGKFQGPGGDSRITGRGPETDRKLGCPCSLEQVLKREPK